MILEICIYFNMDQDVDKRAGFLEGIIPSYFVVGLVEWCSYDALLCLCWNYMGKQYKLLCVSNYNMYGYIFNNYTYYMNRNVIKVAGLSRMVVNSFPNFLKDMFILYNTLEKIGQRLYIF